MKQVNDKNIVEIIDIHKYFGGIKALKGVSFELSKNKITGLIGPNGSGKTTLFNIITGLYQPTKGKVLFEGVNIAGKKVHKVAGMGIGRTFQNLKLFMDSTVLENVMVGGHRLLDKEKLLDVFLNTSKFKQVEKEAVSKAQEIIQFVGLSNKSKELVKSLSYGERKRVELARAFATNPKLLLLDEPVAGMNEQEIAFLLDLIIKLPEKGVTVLLIEHHIKFVAKLSGHIVVLDQGEKIAEGKPDEIQKNPLVIEAYLGKGAENVA